MEKELKLIAIPLLIIYKCLYYIKDAEYFVSESLPIMGHLRDHIKFTNNNLTISSDGLVPYNKFNNAKIACNQIINVNKQSIAKWKLKINDCETNKYGKSTGISIGLTFSTNFIHLIDINCKGYTYLNREEFRLLPVPFQNERFKLLPFSKGDIVEFILNLKRKHICYRVNDKFIRIIKKIPEHQFEYEYKFRLRVSLQTCYKSSVSVIDFYTE